VTCFASRGLRCSFDLTLHRWFQRLLLLSFCVLNLVQ